MIMLKNIELYKKKLMMILKGRKLIECLNAVDIICGDLKNPESLLFKTIIRKLDTSLGMDTIDISRKEVPGLIPQIRILSECSSYEEQTAIKKAVVDKCDSITDKLLVYYRENMGSPNLFFHYHCNGIKRHDNFYFYKWYSKQQ